MSHSLQKSCFQKPGWSRPAALCPVGPGDAPLPPGCLLQRPRQLGGVSGSGSEARRAGSKPLPKIAPMSTGGRASQASLLRLFLLGGLSRVTPMPPEPGDQPAVPSAGEGGCGRRQLGLELCRQGREQLALWLRRSL